eukprot:symbB.v1.2.041168.t2/scaffold7891.1/size8838/1
MSSVLPDPAALARMTQLSDIVTWANVVAPFWEAFNRKIGSCPTIRILSQAPADVIATASKDLRIDLLDADGHAVGNRELTIVESIQVLVAEEMDLSSNYNVCNVNSKSPYRPFVFAEFFAGLGGLSNAMSEIDPDRVTVAATLDGYAGQWDILNDDHYQVATDLVESIDHGHFAPPCRTLTSARRSDEYGTAKTLRSEDRPEGWGDKEAVLANAVIIDDHVSLKDVEELDTDIRSGLDQGLVLRVRKALAEVFGATIEESGLQANLWKKILTAARDPDAAEARGSSGLPLEYYQIWDATWFAPGEYFTNLSVVDRSDFMTCSGSLLADNASAYGYFRVSGDASGMIITTANGITNYKFRCADEHFWHSPGCRSDAEKCVLFVTGGNGWDLVSVTQRSAAYHMPIAVGVAISYGEFIALPSKHRCLFYWWTPDTTFLEMNPWPMIFPPHDPYAYAQGISVTESPTSHMSKLVSHDLLHMAPMIVQLMQNSQLDLEAC